MVESRFTGGFYRWLCVVMVAATLLIWGCNSSGSPTEPASSTDPGELEFQLLQLVNQARQSQGVEPPLVSDPLLADLARLHSRDMRDRGYLSHTTPEGMTLRQRLSAAGIEFRRAAENIAQVTNVSNAASFAHDLLMDSEQHRANILDDRFERVGIGVATSGNTFWITQVFIKP